MRNVALIIAITTGPALATGLEIDVKGAHTDGTITVDLFEDVAPGHVEQITALAAEGFYNGVYFHRVIDGFMAQTGDGEFGKKVDDFREQGRSVMRAGTGGSSRSDLKAEFSDIPFERGIVGMARANDPDSANSQFFIMFDEAENLNGEYTVVGKVTSGLDVLDNIKRGDSSTLQITGEPDHMLSVRVTD